MDSINTFSNQKIKQLPLDLNGIQAHYLKDKSVVALFEEQVLKTPEAIAVVFEDQKLSYQELNARSNQLAHYLTHRGVKAETLVPISIARSLEMIIGILGILKAGGAYVPIDPDYPADRISYILEDTGANLVIGDIVKEIKEELSLTVIDWKEDSSTIIKEFQCNPGVKISPKQLAYVIYTSGSTGKPKGVMIEHQSLLNYLSSSKARFINNEGTNAGSFIHLSYTFDASLISLFTPFLSGKYLVIASKSSIDAFTDANLEKYAPYDFITITPSHLGLLPTTFKNTNCGWLTSKLVIGGEKLRLSDLDFLIKKGISVEIINEYGPTEATIGCCSYSLNTLEDYEFIQTELPIGTPIPNTRVYIANADKELSSIGIIGEICIGGMGLARGYLNHPELTAEKFIKDPFNNEAGARLYKTGDWGRRLPDGNIEYLGRMDDQVKVRGYRIELGEIEDVLNRSGLVHAGIVMAKDDNSGNKLLVGYVVAEGEFDKQAIQKYLGTKLPDYMVPGIWVTLERLPLMVNGKVDRNALPDPELPNMTAEYAPPRNATEEALAGIWRELLGVERIGVYDNFFDLGGHSLLAMRAVSAIRRQLDIELNIDDLFVHPFIAGLGAYLDEQTKGSSLPAIVAGARPEHVPLSFSQERLWFIDQLNGSVQYHLPIVWRLRGELDVEILKKTLQAIINRHEILRTVILEHDGQSYQHIMVADNWYLGIKEHLAGGEAGLSQLITDLIHKPFDLSADYMLRADLIRIHEEHNVLVITMHHIASDGWSASVLVKEISALYEKYASNAGTVLPELSIQYADYAIWQRRYIQGEYLDKKIAYWKEKLKGVSPLQLPTDFSRPLIQSSRGAASTFKIAQDLSEALLSLSHRNEVTLFMTLLSAFRVLLYRYSGQDDICIGTPVAGRVQHELEELIGFFINMLPLRSHVRADMSFSEMLRDIKSITLEAFRHHDAPFEKVVDAVVKERDMSISPLFQVMFVFQNTPEIPTLKLGQLSLNADNPKHTKAQCDIAFMVEETSSGIQGTVEYSTDLYMDATIERMINHYINLLESIVASPELEISRMGILSAEEKAILKEFNAIEVAYPKDKSIVDLFEDRAAKSPESTAVMFEGTKLSYGELNRHSNQLAHYLQSKGVKAETLVPICVERSPKMVIGILGILKAGGVYVPIDPEYPQHRISYMLEDTGAAIVLTSKAGKDKLSTSAAIIELDTDWQQIEKEKDSNPQIGITPDQLAYVIYTSGSTGKPKGVMIQHKNASSFIAWCQQEFASDNFNMVYAVTSICFDLSIFELFYPLSMGKPVRILENGPAIGNYLAEDSAVLINTIPSVIEYLINEKTDLSMASVINMAGEPVPLRVLERLDMIHTTVRNLYGPTEDTTYSTMSVLEKGKLITIGKPISNTQIYILSGDKELTPIGVAGEICIGGAGLSRGYLNRKDLTAEKFINDPFSKKTEARLYKTGDLGRWLPDGNIEYLGRMDDQVKIRGYRIELGEIENVLNESEQVNQAVVLAKEDNSGNKRLIGYVVHEGAFDKQAIQNYLSTKLPEYMVPALWVELEKLPLTPNGKIDRKALPDPELTDRAAEYVASRNETETKLAEIWQELLGLERIGINDNFFELGGHSLLAMRAVSLIRRELNIELSIMDLFVYPSIAALISQLESKNKTTSQLLIPIRATGDKIPLYIICGAGGTAFQFLDFVKMLNHEQPVYGLQQPMHTKYLKEFPNTIEEIAHIYIKEILKQNPKGPYALSGHCLGGNVAFEMAVQLKSMGKEVAMLSLFDSYTIKKEEILTASFNYIFPMPGLIKKRISKISLKMDLEMFLLLKYPKQYFQYKFEKVKSIIGVNKTKLGDAELKSFNKVSKVFETAKCNYKMKHYEGDILVFYAKEHYYFTDRNKGIYYKRISISNETKNSWKKHARSVEIYEIEGEHSTMFDLKHAAELAEIVQSSLKSINIIENENSQVFC
ncbi:MAG: amino acid adenylation enzyme/thioester reductase family protein [Mucilaginibacter sp.]|nr:amino acid adenylation enzyme/thioester reductase family protein [Mucilaginibacter sp.]